MHGFEPCGRRSNETCVALVANQREPWKARSSGLRLTAFEEHQSVPWDPFGAAGFKDEQAEYRLRERSERLPATYTLQAVK
jgi:hypothetical protein